jgi:hypothetical protein
MKSILTGLSFVDAMTSSRRKLEESVAWPPERVNCGMLLAPNRFNVPTHPFTSRSLRIGPPTIEAVEFQTRR